MVTMLSTSRFLRPVSVSVFTLTPLAHKHTHTHTLICLHSSNPAQRSTCAEVCSTHLSVVQQWTVQHSVTRWHNIDLERTVGLSNGDGWNSARLTLTDGILFFSIIVKVIVDPLLMNIFCLCLTLILQLRQNWRLRRSSCQTPRKCKSYFFFFSSIHFLFW